MNANFLLGVIKFDCFQQEQQTLELKF
jgi:hypothetical protein